MMSNAHSERIAPDHSNVVVFPPLIPASGMLLGLLLMKLAPPHLALSDGALIVLRTLGASLLCISAAGLAWMVVTMKRARTPIHTAKTPTALVETGPFRRTRNPMYLFGSTGYAGVTLLLMLPWSLALLPAVMVAMHYAVVLREEAYLERKFGSAYLAYKQRVPRWL